MPTIYRFANAAFKTDLSGQGAKLFGGRWNSLGLPALYCSYTISLAMIELFVHKQTYEQMANQYLLEIELAATIDITIDENKLKKNWQYDKDYCQFIGNQFLQNNNWLAMQVPSAIIPQENNIVLNPLALHFAKKVKLQKLSVFNFDERLFK
jgi:RES domain-containing protein